MNPFNEEQDDLIEQEILDAQANEEQLLQPKEPSALEQLQELANKYQVAKTAAPKATPQIQQNPAPDQMSQIDKAIQERDKRQQMGNLLKSFQQITQAGVNVGDPNFKINTEVADSIHKSGQDPINDYKLKEQTQRNIKSDTQDTEKHEVVMQEFRQKLDKSNLDIMNQEKLSDPNSDESKMAQDFVLRLDPKLNPETVRKANATTLFKMSPLMQKMIVDKLKSQRGNSQITNIQDPDGVTRTYMVDKSTGDMKPLGTAGYALGQGVDPTTGMPYRFSKANQNAPATDLVLPKQEVLVKQQEQQAEKPVEYKPIEFAEVSRTAPKIAQTLTKVQDTMMRDMKDSREVASAVTNLQSKLQSGTAWGEGVDSGLLGGIQTQAAKMAGQKGVLTDQDLVKFAGAGGVPAAIDRLVSNPQGKMSDSDVKFFKRFAQLMGESLKKDVDNRSEYFIQQAKQQVQAIKPDVSDDNVKKMLGVDKIVPVVQNKKLDDKVKVRLPDGRTGVIPKANLEKAKSQGAVEVE